MSETAPSSGGAAGEGSGTAGLAVGVVRERWARERRVAVVPDDVARLAKAGMTVLVEEGAGSAAWMSDDAYRAAGAAVVTRDELVAQAQVVLTVRKPSPDVLAGLRPGQAVVGLLQPLTDLDLVRELAGRSVTALSLDGLPRTLSRAQTMDALTSQANIAGYKAALVAADSFGRFFPLLITASGTSKPADVLVLGAGVAGLQAMGTARRLGALVTGYDVRPETKTEVESVGARFLVLETALSGSGSGGYARELTAEEQAAQQQQLDSHIARRDVVITTAQVPGRRPPLLVTSAALESMRPGTVVVDVAASALGGNVEGSVDGETIVTPGGVTIVGAGNLPAEVPAAASAAYSRNVSALLAHVVRDGRLVIDLDDEIQAGVVVTHGGAIVHPAVAALAGDQTPGARP